MKKLLFMSLALMAMTSCTQQKSNEKAALEGDSTVVADTMVTIKMEELTNLELIKSLPTADRDKKILEICNLSTITNDVEYIVLGSKNDKGEEEYIRQALQVIVGKEYIFVNTTDRVLQYQRDGKFIRKIGKSGQGPKEYSFVENIDIDETVGRIYIKSGVKLVVYSFDGEHVKDISFHNVPLFAMLNDTLFAASYDNKYGDAPNRLILQNEKKDTIKAFPNYVKFKSLNPGAPPSLFPNTNQNFYRYNGDVYYRETYNDTIFRISPNYELIPTYFLDWGKSAMTTEKRPEYLKDKNRIGEECVNLFRTKILETEHYLFMPYFSYNTEFGSPINMTGFNVYNKQKKTLHFICPRYDMDHRDFPKLLKGTGFMIMGYQNNIDGGLPFFPDAVSTDGYLFNYMLAADFKDVIDAMGYYEEDVIAEKQQKLKEFVKSLNEYSDNLVITMVKPK
ncbi:MAG: 6-bladed beta-propeller [Bacteroidales bacterium]|nr:6-bladed beta-propeller [Bacteroidales bacterium]